HSRAMASWIGAPREGEAVWELFGRVSPDFGSWLELGWPALSEDVLPFEMALAQLPARLMANGRTLEVAYQPVESEGCIERFLIVVTDASERVERERGDALQREMLTVFDKLMHDRSGFVE